MVDASLFQIFFIPVRLRFGYLQKLPSAKHFKNLFIAQQQRLSDGIDLGSSAIL